MLINTCSLKIDKLNQNFTCKFGKIPLKTLKNKCVRFYKYVVFFTNLLLPCCASESQWSTRPGTVSTHTLCLMGMMRLSSLILFCFQTIYFSSFHVPLFPIRRRNVCVHCVLCKHCLTKSISFGTVFIPISHYIRYTCIIPGCLQKYIYSSWQRFSTMPDALLSLVHDSMT